VRERAQLSARGHCSEGLVPYNNTCCVVSQVSQLACDALLALVHGGNEFDGRIVDGARDAALQRPSEIFKNMFP